jgi:DNA-binding response OmpR family regulator
VEDNEADVFLLRMAFEEAGLPFELKVCSDGPDILGLIDDTDAGIAPVPDLLLLDLNLPRCGGEKILQRLRQSSKCGSIPVIVITSSDSPQDRVRAAALGATYFRKPTDLDEFMKIADLVKEILLKTKRSGLTNSATQGQ